MTNPDFENCLLLRDLLRCGDWLSVDVDGELVVVHREDSGVYVRFPVDNEPLPSVMIRSAFSAKEQNEIVQFARTVIRASVLCCAIKSENRVKVM